MVTLDRWSVYSLSRCAHTLDQVELDFSTRAKTLEDQEEELKMSKCDRYSYLQNVANASLFCFRKLTTVNLVVLYINVLRIKLICGLVCELTLRMNRHSNGQESPLCHHYVF